MEDKITPATGPKELKVLMVDDNKLSRLLASAVLKKIGWHLDEAENGLQALEKLRANRYDLVLMDIQMPEMDGIEATVKIRSETRTAYSRIPIIACISNATESNSWLTAGMNDCISKPFDAETLLAKVATLLKTNPSTINTEARSAPTTEKMPVNDRENGIINLEKLTSLSGNSKVAINNIIQVFLKQVPKQMENLISLVEQKDWGNVSALSHKMKSSYAIIGATSVKNLLETMEEDCTQNNIDENKFRLLMEKVILLNEEVIKSIRTIAV